MIPAGTLMTTRSTLLLLVFSKFHRIKVFTSLKKLASPVLVMWVYEGRLMAQSGHEAHHL